MGSASPQLDKRIDFGGTFAALQAVSTAGFPSGTVAYTSDLGEAIWNGSYWEMQTAADGLVASATQTQAAGTPLVAAMNRIATCATAGNAATLRASAPGMQITLTNAGANSANIFPNAGGTTTETINALSANAAFALGAGKSTTFCCYTAGQWHTIPLVP